MRYAAPATANAASSGLIAATVTGTAISTPARGGGLVAGESALDRVPAQ